MQYDETLTISGLYSELGVFKKTDNTGKNPFLGFTKTIVFKTPNKKNFK
ncbi:MAG: hypothetical protein CM15mP32_4530 [Flavobacteriaceae bacterium]|nr:MAG: hypothetical protein CM15mP32_4530 [Flavobacteriaceae bacterium]